MVAVQRRRFLSGILLALPALGEARKESLRGKLIDGSKLQTAEGRIITLEGDEPTKGVLKDPRVIGSDFEVVGTFTAPDTMQIEPIHTRSMFVHKDGKRLMVTYWCDVCYIRTYTPGICWCCQDETELDLIEREK
jgi:hypothetical protein